MSRKKKHETKAERHHKDLETLIKLREIEHKTIDQCAEDLRVHPRTIKYWLASDEYKAVREEVRNDWRESAITHTHSTAKLVVDTLIDLAMHDKSGHVRFEAVAKLGDWIGIQRLQEEQQGDDSAELARMMRILAEKPTSITQNNTIYLETPEPGGFLPKPLQRVVDVSGYLPAAKQPTDFFSDLGEEGDYRG